MNIEELLCKLNLEVTKLCKGDMEGTIWFLVFYGQKIRHGKVGGLKNLRYFDANEPSAHQTMGPLTSTLNGFT